jgi:UDP-glucuronate decarboxylase
MSNYIRNAIRNEPLQVFGDGSQTRSFCYVDDLIEGILKFALADKDVTGPINLGNTVEITMLELAKEVIARVESGSSIIFKDLPGDDPKQRMPDIRLAKSTLGWEPTTSYGDGINTMIEDFRKRMSI